MSSMRYGKFRATDALKERDVVAFIVGLELGGGEGGIAAGEEDDRVSHTGLCLTGLFFSCISVVLENL